MIVRKEPNGEQLLLRQTDHSRLAGRFASHWGNATFAAPEPFESVVRAATFHDFGYLRYETPRPSTPRPGRRRTFATSSPTVSASRNTSGASTGFLAPIRTPVTW